MGGKICCMKICRWDKVIKLAKARKGCEKWQGKRAKLNERAALWWTKLSIDTFKVMCVAGQTRSFLDTRKGAEWWVRAKWKCGQMSGSSLQNSAQCCAALEQAGGECSGRAARLSVRLPHLELCAEPGSAYFRRDAGELKGLWGETESLWTAPSEEKEETGCQTAGWEGMLEGNKIMRLMSTSVLPFPITQEWGNAQRN